MRVLYLSCHPHLRTASNAGYSTHIRETIAALRRLGHEVVPWIAGDQGAPAEDRVAERPPAVSWARRVVPGFAWQGLRDTALIRHDVLLDPELRDVVRRVSPDVVYERASYLSGAGVRTAERTGTPLVLEVNAPYVEERRNLHGAGMMEAAGRRWERRVLRGASCVVAVSSVLADRLAEAAGVDRARVHVQPNGVDSRRFPADVPSARSELGIADDAFVVAFVGSFIRWHRLEVLIEAVARLREGGRPAHGLLVGDGEVRDHLEDRVAELGVADHVTFTGSVAFERVPSLVKAADVCVIPGHAWYCSPIKLFEYGGVGKAVVSLDSAPVREVVREGEECLFFDGSVDALVGLLRELHDDPGRRAGLEASLRRAVTERFTWDAAATRISGWLHDVVGGAGALG
jgi:glycosyltransferase involved in cell wall biosynthesis